MEKETVSAAEDYIAWKDGKIKFANTRLDEVVRRLNVSFRSRIKLSDKYLGSQRIYGEFSMHDPVNEVVENLCMLTGTKYLTKPQGEIAIYPFDKNRVLTKTDPMK